MGQSVQEMADMTVPVALISNWRSPDSKDSNFQNAVMFFCRLYSNVLHYVLDVQTGKVLSVVVANKRQARTY